MSHRIKEDWAYVYWQLILYLYPWTVFGIVFPCHDLLVTLQWLDKWKMHFSKVLKHLIATINSRCIWKLAFLSWMRLRTIVKMAPGCNFISCFPFLLGLLILTPVIKCLTPLEKTGLFIQGYMPMINITELMVLESSTSNPDRELFEGVDFTG